MGMLDRILGKSATPGTGLDVAGTTDRALTRAGEVLGRAGTSLSETGTAALDRAGRFYKANPRKVQAIGLLAAAALLVGVRNRGRTL